MQIRKSKDEFCDIISPAMKLKRPETQSAANDAPAEPTQAGGAVIADRFKLDAVQEDGKSGPNKVATMIAFLGALLALAAVGTVAALMYQNWQLIENA